MLLIQSIFIGIYVLIKHVTFFKWASIVLMPIIVLSLESAAYTINVWLCKIIMNNKYLVLIMLSWILIKIYLIFKGIINLSNFHHYFVLWLMSLILCVIGNYLDKKFGTKELIKNSLVRFTIGLPYILFLVPYIKANEVLIINKLIVFWWLGFDPIIIDTVISSLSDSDTHLFITTGLILAPSLPFREYYINMLQPYLITRSRMVSFRVNPQPVTVPYQGHPQWIWENLSSINNRIFFVMHMFHQAMPANFPPYTYPAHPLNYTYPVFGLDPISDLVAARVLSFTLETIHNDYNINYEPRDYLVINKQGVNRTGIKWYKDFLRANERNPNNTIAFREFCGTQRGNWINGRHCITSQSITTLKQWLPKV